MIKTRTNKLFLKKQKMQIQPQRCNNQTSKIIKISFRKKTINSNKKKIQMMMNPNNFNSKKFSKRSKNFYKKIKF